MRAIYTKTKAGVFRYTGTAHRRTLRCPGKAGDGAPCGEQIAGASLDPKKVRILGFEQKLRAGEYGMRVPVIEVTVYCMGCLKVWKSRSRWLGELVKQAFEWESQRGRAALFRLPKPGKR